MRDRKFVTFAVAAQMLWSIKSDTNRLDLVLALQRLLVRRIVREERRINRVGGFCSALRKSLRHDHLSKDASTIAKARIKRCTEVVDELRHRLFLWRTFGDGIAFIYQSKHSLRHFYYDENYQVKEDAGFITGKAGFRREWELLRLGIRMDVPVVLCDITNVLRYGDLCALAGEDPVPIEVKASSNRNARSRRQLDRLRELTDFFANDGSDSFRGIPGRTERMALRTPELTHEEAANNCIERAIANGSFTIQPEPGMRYIAFTGAELPLSFSEYLSPPVLTYVLSAAPSYLPAYPFTLSLTPKNLIEFISGNVVLLVLIDLRHLKSEFLKYDIHTTVLMNGDSAMQLCLDPTDLWKGCYRVSENRFGRAACEFVSLSWFAKETAHQLRDLSKAKPISQEQASALVESGAYITELPPDWLNAKDCF